MQNIRFAFCLFTIVTFSFFSFNHLQAQDLNEDLEELSFLVELPDYSFLNIEGLYNSQNQVFYLEVENLFSNLKIVCKEGKGGDSLGGYFNQEHGKYLIDYDKGTISFGKLIFDVHNGMIKRLDHVFLESSIFKKVFGIELKLNFRSLMISLKSEFELPIIKELRQEKIRNNLFRIRSETKPDTIVHRKYHIFKPGTLNWSAIGSQFSNHTSDNQFSLSLGTEFMYGDLGIFINYSTQTHFTNGQQQFLWHWVDNNKKIIRQFSLGRITSSSISTIYSPMYGAVLTNSPTTIRKATGFYAITDYTEPNWLVELYINNVLIGYQRTDSQGLYSFNVPIVYGFTNLILKFYGPNGEERVKQKTMNTPFSLMPLHTFEYKITSSVVTDSSNSKFGRGEFSYGIGRTLSLNAGIEYLSSIPVNPLIPFIGISFLPLSKVMLNGMFAKNVGFNGIMSIFLPANSFFQFTYSNYIAGQKAIHYNYLEQRNFSLTVPYRIKYAGGSVKLSLKQDVYPSFIYNQAEFILSTTYKKANLNLSGNGNWVSGHSLYAYANLSLGYNIRSGLICRVLGLFNVTSKQLTNIRIDVEKQVLKSGFFSLAYDLNVPQSYHGVNITFRYNFKYAQTNFSTRLTNQGVFTSEGASGSLAFGGGNGFIDANNSMSVGRGGLTIVPFIDKNHNDIYDEGETIASGLIINGNGGRRLVSTKDSLMRFFGLEPFLYNDIIFKEGDFENLSWHLRQKYYRVMIDPDQFKRIEIPIQPMGEITGIVNFADSNSTKGIGRIQLNIFTNSGKKIAQTLSESDGYLSYLGLNPGEFYVQIDSLQLKRIGFISEPDKIPFTINPTDEGDVIDNIEFTVRAITVDSVNNKHDSSKIPLPPTTFDIDSINTRFEIEISHYSDELEAMNINNRLKNVEVSAVIIHENGIYKLRISPIPTLTEAEALLEKIKNLGILDAKIVKIKKE